MTSGSTVRKFVAVDPSKCTGCSLCEFICVLEKKEPVLNPLRSRIRVMRISPLLNAALTCRLCEDAPCVNACPRDALTQSESGVIIVDETKCDRCGWCIGACPYGGVTLHPEESTVLICDLCGGEPKCVEICPEDALKIVFSDGEADEIWRAAMEHVLVEADKLANIAKNREVSAFFEGIEEKAQRFNEKLKEIEKMFASQSSK